MDKTIAVGLSGHAAPYRLHEDAYDRLSRYLDRAAAGLHDDPDQAEVLGDLERSVGDKLAALLGAEDRVVTAADIDGVLEQIGAVDTGREPAADDGPAAGQAPRPTRPPGRRLHRTREGQQIAGVCAGLAEYSEIDVDWVRTLFIFAALLTAGIWILVYVAMAFILPVTSTNEAS
jgi:phage shock protein PspC (stress-responsive transcriptional regulator)